MATNTPLVPPATSPTEVGSHAPSNTKAAFARPVGTRGDWWGTAREMWLWPLAILLGLPIAGYAADLAVNGVDSFGTAIVGGLITGALMGAAGWLALRKRIHWLWIPATTIGMAVGLAVGAALVGYGIDRGDLMVMGAITGLGVGIAQSLVLVRQRVSGAFWWALANPPAWALGWLVTSYVIARNVKEQFTVFGASGAIVFGLLTWFVLALLFRRQPAGRTQDQPGLRQSSA